MVALGPGLVGMSSVDEARCVGGGDGVERRRSHLAASRWFWGRVRSAFDAVQRSRDLLKGMKGMKGMKKYGL